MTDARQTRRAFIAGGALSAAGLVVRDVLAGAAESGQGRGPRSGPGIALGPDDFAFAPGLIYLQTGSLGPTPKPVMARAMAAWKQLELNPTYFGYGELE